jgi:hypothetical protein
MSQETQQVIDQETGLPVLVPGMKQGMQNEAGETAREADVRRVARRASAPGLPQPLATRHHDPNWNPDIDTEKLGPKVKKTRCILRAGYYFYYGRGNREAFRGPAILWLTDEQIEGQKQKLEVLGDKPAHMHSKAKPVAIAEAETAEERQARIDMIKGELEILEAEQKVYLEGKRKPEEERTLASPDINADAETPELSPSAPPTPTAEADEVEAAPPALPAPGAGTIAAPEHNPEDVPPVKKKRGRPKGSKSKIS